MKDQLQKLDKELLQLEKATHEVRQKAKQSVQTVARREAELQGIKEESEIISDDLAKVRTNKRQRQTKKPTPARK